MRLKKLLSLPYSASLLSSGHVRMGERRLLRHVPTRITGIPILNIFDIVGQQIEILHQISTAPSSGTILHDLIRRGHTGEAIQLAQQHPDMLLAQDNQGATPIFLAALFGNTCFLAYTTGLLDSHGTPLVHCSYFDLALPSGLTPVIAATLAGNTETVQFFLNAGGFHPDNALPDGTTALHAAAQCGHVDIARALIVAHNHWIRSSLPLNPPINTDQLLRRSNGDSPLHLAVMGNKVAIAALFLDHFLIRTADEPPRYRLFVQDDALLADGRSLLDLTAQAGHLETFCYLVSKGENPDKVRPGVETPRQIATKNGHAHITRALEAPIVSPLLPDPAPLLDAEKHHAINTANPEVLIREWNRNPASKKVDIQDLLPYAKAGRHGQMGAWLYEQWQVVEGLETGWVPSALGFAVIDEFPEAVQILLDQGYSPDFKPQFGKLSPLEWAMVFEMYDMYNRVLPYSNVIKGCAETCTALFKVANQANRPQYLTPAIMAHVWHDMQVTPFFSRYILAHQDLTFLQQILAKPGISIQVLVTLCREAIKLNNQVAFNIISPMLVTIEKTDLSDLINEAAITGNPSYITTLRGFSKGKTLTLDKPIQRAIDTDNAGILEQLILTFPFFPIDIAPGMPVAPSWTTFINRLVPQIIARSSTNCLRLVAPYILRDDLKKHFAFSATCQVPSVSCGRILTEHGYRLVDHALDEKEVYCFFDEERDQNITIQFYLECGASPNLRSRRTGEYPVYTAIRTRNILLLALLIQFNADPKLACGDKKKLPGHLAVENRSYTGVEQLIKGGIDLRLEDEGNRTMLQRAYKAGLDDIVALLQRHGANLSILTRIRYSNYREGHPDPSTSLSEGVSDVRPLPEPKKPSVQNRNPESTNLPPLVPTPSTPFQLNDATHISAELLLGAHRRTGQNSLKTSVPVNLVPFCLPAIRKFFLQCQTSPPISDIIRSKIESHKPALVALVPGTVDEVFSELVPAGKKFTMAELSPLFSAIQNEIAKRLTQTLHNGIIGALINAYWEKFFTHPQFFGISTLSETLMTYVRDQAAQGKLPETLSDKLMIAYRKGDLKFFNTIFSLTHFHKLPNGFHLFLQTWEREIVLKGINSLNVWCADILSEKSLAARLDPICRDSGIPNFILTDIAKRPIFNSAGFLDILWKEGRLGVVGNTLYDTAKARV